MSRRSHKSVQLCTLKHEVRKTIVDTAISHNADCANLTKEFSERTGLLTREIRQVKQDKKSEVSLKFASRRIPSHHNHHRNITVDQFSLFFQQMLDLLTKLDRQEESMKSSSRSYIQRISQLSEALEDRKSQFNQLVGK